MEAKDIRKVHCFFEQSGTFKNEFIKLGIPAEDYDIQNNFNQTDHVIDLFAEIEAEYDKQTNKQTNKRYSTALRRTTSWWRSSRVFILKRYNNFILLYVKTILETSLRRFKLNTQ